LKERKLRAFQFIEGGARYGAAVSIMNIAEGMRQGDVEVEFGVFAGRPLGAVLREHDFTVHEIPANHRFDMRGVRALVKLFRAKRFDVVHTHLSRATVNGLIASRLTRTPIVATVHGMNRKYTYMLADHIMTVSEAAKRHLMNQGVDEEKITPVYNCIQLEPFASRPSKPEAKAAFDYSPQSFVVGTISRAHRQKGIDVAIGAVAELRKRGIDAKYLFVGDGPHLAEFKALSDELQISEHARFTGFSASVVAALSAMDVFMFPTHREAFGISLLEAMAAEVPTVASAVDGVPEVLDAERVGSQQEWSQVGDDFAHGVLVAPAPGLAEAYNTGVRGQPHHRMGTGDFRTYVQDLDGVNFHGISPSSLGEGELAT